MIDFQTALKARIPFIGVHTDDPVNFVAVAGKLSGKHLKQLPNPPSRTMPLTDGYLWWTEQAADITTERYRLLCDTGATVVVLNPSQANTLVLDVGMLPTPDQFFVTYLKGFVNEDWIPGIVQVLQGLSLKAAQEIVQITMARTAALTPKDVRKTRQLISAQHPGLVSLDTDYDFYEWPEEFKDWLTINDTYFLDPATPEKLVPRGILLAGDPGTGKSMGAQVLAKHWDVPLFRLDVSMSLNRYLGESESRIARSLSLIEQSAPCVWLLDEVEKLFGRGGDEGTTDRILSQLLWWLQSHNARVMTVMTTNNLGALPPELYRPGRIDQVIRTERLGHTHAKAFAYRTFHSVIGQEPTPKQTKVMREALLQQEPLLTHAVVRVIVYNLIKTKGWLKERHACAEESPLTKDTPVA